MLNSTWYRARSADSLCAAALVSAAERADLRRALSSETAITPAGARRLIHIDQVSPESLYDALEMGVNIAIRAGG